MQRFEINIDAKVTLGFTGELLKTIHVNNSVVRVYLSNTDKFIVISSLGVGSPSKVKVRYLVVEKSDLIRENYDKPFFQRIFTPMPKARLARKISALVERRTDNSLVQDLVKVIMHAAGVDVPQLVEL